jgi:hypothetical protein
MGVDDRVFFLPGLDNHEVQILLARCLCVVFAPVREPFGIVALEALAAGKPLIAVNEGGYVEVIDESCAVLVPPEPLALAREIRRFHADPAFAERLGRQGREVARQYSWDRTARELGAIIEQAHRQWVIQHRPVKNSSGPLFAAHYFSWYREGFGSAHWCDDPATGWVTDVPELGYYSSINGDTLTTHLDQVERTGVDALIFNLHVSDDGIDLFQLAAMQRMMAIAKERGSSLRFAVNFCLYTQDIENIRQAVRILETSVLNQDSYLCVDSKRIFMIFWTGTFDHNIALIEQLRILLSGYLRIGSYMRPIDASSEARRTLGLFHAISPFSPLELGSSGTWEEVWRREYDSSSQASGYRCLTICPGYDDSHLLDQARRRGVRTIPHGDGATYRRMMDFALAQSAPHFVFITSFNEFHENTHIEPSRNHGSKYLDMTRDFIGDARARWGGGNLAVEGKIARPEGVNCEN